MIPVTSCKLTPTKIPNAPEPTAFYSRIYNKNTTKSPFKEAIQRFFKMKNWNLFKVCFAQIIISGKSFYRLDKIYLGIIFFSWLWCRNKVTEEYFPYYCPNILALIISSLFILNGLIGIWTAKRNTIKLYTTHLVLSIISSVFCIIGCLMAFW